jgi:hypothetical protein
MFQIFCGADVPRIRDRETSAIVQLPKFSPLIFDGWHIVYSIIQSFNHSIVVASTKLIGVAMFGDSIRRHQKRNEKLPQALPGYR